MYYIACNSLPFKGNTSTRKNKRGGLKSYQAIWGGGGRDFGWGYNLVSVLSVYLPTHKIPKYVQAIEVWRLTTSIDVASCNRFPHFVWICINWKHIICREEKICDLFCTCCRIALYLDCSETGRVQSGSLVHPPFKWIANGVVFSLIFTFSESHLIALPLIKILQHSPEPFSSHYNPSLLVPHLAHFYRACLVQLRIHRLLLESLHSCRKSLPMQLCLVGERKKRDGWLQTAPMKICQMSAQIASVLLRWRSNLKGPSNIYGIAQAWMM